MKNIKFFRKHIYIQMISSMLNKENEGMTSFGFSPFDDSLEAGRYELALVYHQTGSGMNTTPFDCYRQGIELTMPKYLYGTSQPKFWVGNLEHRINVHALGQPRTWTEYMSSSKYDDMVVRFDSDQYIRNPQNYPYPIYFNDGPQEAEEACIEPLTIPFKTTLMDSSDPARTIKGNLGDGNCLDGEIGNSLIKQFVDYSGSQTPRYFLDLGQDYFGAGSLVDCIIREGYVPFIQRLNAPFNDTANEEVVAQVTSYTETVSATFIGRLKELKMELELDIRETFSQKSMPAGTTVYGVNQARYGTDSLAYLNWIRGS